MSDKIFSSGKDVLQLTGEACDHLEISLASKHHLIPGVVKKLMQSWSTKECYDHVSPVAIPSHQAIIDILEQARRILFPGYFTSAKLHASNLEYYIGKETTELYDKLTEQLTMAIRHDCRRNNQLCTNCETRSSEMAFRFIETLPKVASILSQDIRATLERRSRKQKPRRSHFQLPGAESNYRVPPGSRASPSPGANDSENHDGVGPWRNRYRY